AARRKGVTRQLTRVSPIGPRDAAEASILGTGLSELWLTASNQPRRCSRPGAANHEPGDLLLDRILAIYRFGYGWIVAIAKGDLPLVIKGDEKSEIVVADLRDKGTLVPPSGAGQFGEDRRLPEHVLTAADHDHHVVGDDRLVSRGNDSRKLRQLMGVRTIGAVARSRQGRQQRSNRQAGGDSDAEHRPKLRLVTEAACNFTWSHRRE